MWLPPPSDLDRAEKRQQIQHSPKTLSNVSIHFLHIYLIYSHKQSNTN